MKPSRLLLLLARCLAILGFAALGLAALPPALASEETEAAPPPAETQEAEEQPAANEEPEAEPLEGEPSASEALEAEPDASGQAGAAPMEQLPPEPPPGARLPLDALRLFAEAFNRVSSAYVEDIDDRELLEKAIRGFLMQLDPHSAFLDESSYSDLQETTTGNYGGLGLEISMEDGFVKVVAPMDGTPAAKAGLSPNDLILKLDEMPVKGMNLSEAVETMRGEAGSQITLTVLKVGESLPTEVTLTREVIEVASVRHRLIDGFGYIRIAQFQKDTGTEVEEALRELAEDQPLPGLVLDLRSNPGGVLESGIHVADLFISEGLIVYTQGRLPESERRYEAVRQDMAAGVPMVALVNAGTASASEIVAGALQDHKRALVMGTYTFGKGSVQTILPLASERAIKLTTARYYTPSGASIQAEGIVPDIFVEASEVTPRSRRAIKERDLPGHLTSSKEGDAPPPEPADMALAQRDFQLHEALTLLKGLSILAQSQPNAADEDAPTEAAEGEG